MRLTQSQSIYAISCSAVAIQIRSVGIALRIVIVEGWTFGGVHHCPLARLIPQQATTIGQNEDHDLTEQRREGSFRENQTFNTIDFLCVSKMQHSDIDDHHSITSSSPPML